MEITEVRIKLMNDPHDRLQAFCSITFSSSFVIRDLKIIQGTKGPFVAMPSRKLTDRCPKCHSKNHLRSMFCNQCGTRLHMERAVKDYDGRAKLYADIAHPINSECREMIQHEVIKAFQQEIIESQKPGYICRYDDFGEENYAHLYDDDQHEELIGQQEKHTPPKVDHEASVPTTAPKVLEKNGSVFRFDAAHKNDSLTSKPQPDHGTSVPSKQKSSHEEFGGGID
jgi:stage V sporulation protein G